MSASVSEDKKEDPQKEDVDVDQHRSFSGLLVDFQDMSRLPEPTRRVIEAATRNRARGNK